jgi:hypothetical protein
MREKNKMRCSEYSENTMDSLSHHIMIVLIYVSIHQARESGVKRHNIGFVKTTMNSAAHSKGTTPKAPLFCAMPALAAS